MRRLVLFLILSTTGGRIAFLWGVDWQPAPHNELFRIHNTTRDYLHGSIFVVTQLGDANFGKLGVASGEEGGMPGIEFLARE